MSYGQKSHVALAFQAAWGTSNVTSLYHIQHLEESVGLNIPPLVDESAQGIFDEGESYAGPRTVDGSLNTNAKPIPLGVLFKGVFGSPTTVTSTGVHTHTFKPAVSDFSDDSAGLPMTYFKHMDDAGSASVFYNLNIGQLELSCANGEFMMANATFVGGSFEQNADVAAAYPTGKRFTWDNSSLQLGGAAASDFRDLTITINEQLEAMHTMNNSPYPSRVKRTAKRTIEVSGTVVFDDQAEYQKFIAQTEQPFVVSFAGTSEIQSGYTEEVTLTMPALRYSEFKPVAGGSGKTEVGFTASAKYHVGSATAFEATLVNTQAAY